MATKNDTMQARIEALERQIAQLTGRAPQQKSIPENERADAIEHGSPRHVAFLGLREATAAEVAQAKKKEDANEIGLAYKHKDGTVYVLADLTAFGVTADRAMLKAILMQKVHQLKKPPLPQSDDPNEPNYAPRLWVPSGIPVSGTVGG